MALLWAGRAAGKGARDSCKRIQVSGCWLMGLEEGWGMAARPPGAEGRRAGCGDSGNAKNSAGAGAAVRLHQSGRRQPVFVHAMAEG